MTQGWGATGWGYGGWGAGSEELRLMEVQPVRENVVRLTFNAPPLYTGLLNPRDASNPNRYVITPVAGTLRGKDPRQVTAAQAVRSAVEGARGCMIDVVVDRSFSAYPGRYRVSVNQLVTVDGVPLRPDSTSRLFDGMVRYEPPPRRDTKLPTRDIANPQLRSALFDPLPQTTDPLILGSIPVDDQGDYAFDEGITNYKKRVLRRLVTVKGRYAHLPGYGVGLPAQLKRSAKPSLLAALASDTERQILQEPETERIKATLVRDDANPGLFYLRLRIKTKFGGDAIDMTVPFSPTE